MKQAAMEIGKVKKKELIEFEIDKKPPNRSLLLN